MRRFTQSCEIIILETCSHMHRIQRKKESIELLLLLLCVLLTLVSAPRISALSNSFGQSAVFLGEEVWFIDIFREVHV